MQRRTFLGGASATALGAWAGSAQASCGFEICRSEAEWRAQLSDLQFQVMRREATEQPHSSKLLYEERVGTYHCRGCRLPVYPSATKYDSKTGWPSFYDNLPRAIGTKTDRKLVFQVRTEVHCRRCGSHLGHIFDDGPAPTGKRHCLNGVSLLFAAA